MSRVKHDYTLRYREDENERPCPSCGRWGYTVGGTHPELGLVCDGCLKLLCQPIMPGMMPTAFLEGWPYRTKRPTGAG